MNGETRQDHRPQEIAAAVRGGGGVSSIHLEGNTLLWLHFRATDSSELCYSFIRILRESVFWYDLVGFSSQPV